MTLEEAIRKRVRELAKERNITINMVSTLAGLTHTTLLSFMNNETHNPRISTLLHICEAFNITLTEFFDDPIFDNVVDEEENDDRINRALKHIEHASHILETY